MGVINFANREVCNLIMVDYATQKPILNMDYANTTAQELTGESVFAYGGWGHPRRVTFYGEKAGTFTVSTQLMSTELFKIIMGCDMATGATFMERVIVEYKSTDDSFPMPAGLTDTVIYELGDEFGTEIEEEDAVKGKTYVVYGLKTNATAQRMSVTNKTFPKAVTIYAETLMRGENDVDYPYRLVVYKAAPQINFNFSFSNTGDPTTLEIVFDILVDEDGNMVDMLLLDESASA